MFAPYDIPNAYLEGYDVVVNRPKSAAYRAPGAPAAAFAMETAIDKLCEKLGLDPLDFRLLNSAKEGTRRATGPVFPRVGFIETLQAAQSHQQPHGAAARSVSGTSRRQRLLVQWQWASERPGAGEPRRDGEPDRGLARCWGIAHLSRPALRRSPWPPGHRYPPSGRGH